MKMNSFISRLFSAGICFAFLVSSVSAEKIRFYHNDLLGSPIVMTDMDGEVVWAGDYRPFGSEISVGTYAEKPETSYLGKEKVGDVGLNYLMARWYDPASMRFLSQDPVDVMASNPKMFNRYVYAGNSPYTYEDPNGDVLDTFADAGFIIYDVGALVYDEVANSGENRTTNLLALGADVGGFFIPFATGGGTAIRAARGVDNLVDTAKGGDDFVDGYRAVSKAEADDIAKNGFRPKPDGDSMLDKWFSETQDGAEKFKSLYPDLDEVVKAKVPKDVYERSYKHPNIDNTGAGFCVACEDLPKLK